MKTALVVTGGLHPSRREQVIPALLTFVEQLAEEHHVHAFVLRHLSAPQRYMLGRAVVTDLGRPSGWWRQWRSLRRALIATGPFDVVHGWWAAPAGLLAAVCGRHLRIPSVVTCDSGEFVSLPDIDYGLQRTLRGRAVVSIATRLASVVHVTSEYMHSLARAHAVNATRIPLGIDVPEFTFERPDGPPWRLLQVGSLNRVKDQSTLLQALRIVRQHHDVHLDLVGEDTLNGQIQREAQREEIGPSVTFHGFVAHDELSSLHAKAHLYVQSSRHEAAGVAVLEAAAAGVPIVGTRVGYVSDWDGTAALGTLPGEPESLAQAIIALLNNPTRRAHLASAARARAAQYDVNSTLNQMRALYVGLLGSARAGRNGRNPP